jgi:hypothetical protein
LRGAAPRRSGTGPFGTEGNDYTLKVGGEKVTGERRAFEATTFGGRKAGAAAREGSATALPAEYAAILVYTGAEGDFNYINPAQISEPDKDPTKDEKTQPKSWLTQNKEEYGKPVKDEKRGYTKRHAAPWAALSAETLREEGMLHAQVAVAGMEKLDPFTGVSYRGQSTDAIVTSFAPRCFPPSKSTA